MHIKIITVGKIKEKFYTSQIDNFKKTISKFASIELIEVADEKCPEKLSEKEMIQVKDKEGERILSKISSDDYVIALAIEGKMIGSDKFKQIMSKNQVAFVIGGSLGLSSHVMKRSNYQLSFSKMTFPHQLMKVVLMEQIESAVKA
ncbi:23S rRNA (pseudouridine(1915)-N(3))-methyltransferase RlmH [Acidaminobacter sp. JC074]|uniref:23S rRNA (pseudouridine(1915)-N(3))-methyltransferase RlmH n=1 Tax=Acidaminobacter sp. JC074 TaxID=2530199 RepID=UPI001F0FA81B|nr:23S rRNA (pseudouridine(1915)-N(3))-methyltransferase RlmH [Acidaminobacter sp. JC074]MCH4890951.1 23S rRNA (pseudouridine(1915)-N(3))-methyltransferase RlmH [Acidaminobacter sp. JC074]